MNCEENFHQRKNTNFVKNRWKIVRQFAQNQKMKIEKILFLIHSIVCSQKTVVRFIRFKNIPAKHCILKNCQFCAKSFELDSNRFLPQKWSLAGKIVCAKMLLQENCCNKYLHMSRWMMFWMQGRKISIGCLNGSIKFKRPEVSGQIFYRNWTVKWRARDSTLWKTLHVKVTQNCRPTICRTKLGD